MQVTAAGTEKEQQSSVEDSDEEKMDLMEFIRTIDRESREARVGSNHSSPDSQVSTPGATTGNRRFSEAKSTSLEERRKLSGDTSSCSNIPKKLKPSLRMKAYKGRRQETFHSLEAYVAKNDTPDGEEVTSISEDVLKMPAIEALRVSSPSNNAGFGSSSTLRKNYHKINSDPSLVANRKSASVTRDSTGSRNSSVNSKKPNLVLHTIEQPDGGVIGFLAESDEIPLINPSENKPTKK